MKIFLMAVDPLNRYSKESERANLDIYDGFKLKKPFWSPMFFIKKSAFDGLRLLATMQIML